MKCVAVDIELLNRSVYFIIFNHIQSDCNQIYIFSITLDLLFKLRSASLNRIK